MSREDEEAHSRLVLASILASIVRCGLVHCHDAESTHSSLSQDVSFEDVEGVVTLRHCCSRQRSMAQFVMTSLT